MASSVLSRPPTTSAASLGYHSTQPSRISPFMQAFPLGTVTVALRGKKERLAFPERTSAAFPRLRSSKGRKSQTHQAAAEGDAEPTSTLPSEKDPQLDAAASEASSDEAPATAKPFALLANIKDGEFGKRGELWFVAQLLLLAIILFPPIALLPPALTTTFATAKSIFYANVAAGVALIAVGAYFSKNALAELGSNLTPFPKPPSTGTLTTAGLYGAVRHPAYAAQILVAFGISLATASTARLLLALLLAMFFDLKAGQEEKFLVEKFGQEYEEYRGRVKKLVPYVY